jgi:hypothetical protein
LISNSKYLSISGRFLEEGELIWKGVVLGKGVDFKTEKRNINTIPIILLF